MIHYHFDTLCASAQSKLQSQSKLQADMDRLTESVKDHCSATDQSKLQAELTKLQTEIKLTHSQFETRCATAQSKLQSQSKLQADMGRLTEHPIITLSPSDQGLNHLLNIRQKVSPTKRESLQQNETILWANIEQAHTLVTITVDVWSRKHDLFQL